MKYHSLIKEYISQTKTACGSIKNIFFSFLYQIVTEFFISILLKSWGRWPHEYNNNKLRQVLNFRFNFLQSEHVNSIAYVLHVTGSVCKKLPFTAQTLSNQKYFQTLGMCICTAFWPCKQFYNFSLKNISWHFKENQNIPNSFRKRAN